jgi:hypothetical protein
MLKPYDAVGSTDGVDFDTTKPVRQTDPEKCHVNYTVADSRWEHLMDLMFEENQEVIRYVKNQGLGFTIPYSLDGQPKSYYPDFLVDLDDGQGDEDSLHLIVEVSGERDRAKQIKVDTALTLWVPAVNNAARFGRWRFVEVTDPFEGGAIIRSIIAETSAVGASGCRLGRPPREDCRHRSSQPHTPIKGRISPQKSFGTLSLTTRGIPSSSSMSVHSCIRGTLTAILSLYGEVRMTKSWSP